MPRSFPHLNDSAFPDLESVDVYKYANDFDYSRYDALQMQLQLCTVPWDVGEVRVGQSIIPGLGNVVYFETKAKRDKYFSDMTAADCYRFETKYKELHSALEIDIPVPFDVACKYNYLVVKYNLFANDTSLVAYEDAGGLREWFYFIREVEFIAPNSTKLHLILDAWQTFIYDLNIVSMVLERGHAPMAKMSAATYLANPLGKCADLLTPDISNPNASYWGDPAGELILNGDTAANTYAVIVTTANPAGSWGTKAAGTWNTPAISITNTQDGSPALYAFACLTSDLSAVLTSIKTNMPQFVQTIKALFFASKRLVTLGTSFTFGVKTCYPVTCPYKSVDVVTLAKNLFGYDANYADIAKLYTYPYAYLEVSDGNGETVELRIEDTGGKVSFIYRLNLILPFLKVSGAISSTGKNQAKSISFRNISAQTMSIKGNWYKLLMEWDIPTFEVVQSAADNFDFATDFNRKQEQVAYDAAYDSSMWSASQQKDSAYASANTTFYNVADTSLANLNNATDSATTATANAALQTAANTANNTANNTYIDANVQDNNIDTWAKKLLANGQVSGSANNQIAADEQRATMAASCSAVSGATSAITNAVTGNIPGAIGAIVGAGVSAANVMADFSISANLTSSQASLQEAYNDASAGMAQGLNSALATNQKTNNSDTTTNNNSLITGTTANAAALTIGNAERTYDTINGYDDSNNVHHDGTNERDYATATENADRSYEIIAGKTNVDIGNAQRMKNVDISRVDNEVKQAALGEPLEFGNVSNAAYANTKPLGLFANVVTQDNSSIAYAGDEFLRHGYAYNRQWSFNGNWNICKWFTFWKLKDIWTRNINIPDMYVDRIRFLLLGGVTVWRDPAYIGYKGIYDNIDWSNV